MCIYLFSHVVVVLIHGKVKQTFLTDDGEVEGGLSEADGVPQLDGVTAAVFLLTAGDGEFTAAVGAHDGDIRRALLDLTDRHTNTSSQFVPDF